MNPCAGSREDGVDGSVLQTWAGSHFPAASASGNYTAVCLRRLRCPHIPGSQGDSSKVSSCAVRELLKAEHAGPGTEMICKQGWLYT